ncbi:dTDP-glucose 4,6-dehydratase [Labilithrix luteola]|uniref:dTDP-glucose 4,6-dehydratase n=1 Tax=Labilithrix luteola TaxID=1391654 RepID=A0A0K1PN64_9BACT|nr:dTDP-glucose 4,6-dehydratase [Labilithrix luteola]AKU94831.1 dTDP-glucose 4,6-dehydratase [Labilithrix luteola]
MTAARSMLVTGGAGFIGSAFVEAALADGHRVVVLDALTYAGHEESVPKHERCRLVVGNICDRELVGDLLRTEKIDAIVNFAAESHVDRSIDAPGDFVDTNIVGTFRMLQASLAHWKSLDTAEQSRFRYLQISTDEVYGALGETGQFSETSPMSPNSPYAASKAAGDHLVRAWYHTYKLPTLTTNCSNNYGPRQFPEKLIPRLISCALAGEPLPIYGKGLQVRDWIHVEDHSRGVLLALERGTPGQTYCFGGASERANIDVAQRICAILDELRPRGDGKSYASQMQFVTDRPGHDFRYAIDDTRARTELGFTRRHTFEGGLVATIEWYLGNTEWCHAVTRRRHA